MISFDNAGGVYSPNPPPTTLSVTIAGNYVFIFTPVGTNSVTINGVNASVLLSYTPSGSPFGANCPAVRIWGLTNPYIGTSNIITDGTVFSWASYYLIDESAAIPQSFNTADSHAGQQTGTNTSVTTALDGDWVIGFIAGSNNFPQTFTGQAGTTVRFAGNFNAPYAIGDLNTSEAPGTYTCGFDWTSGSGFLTLVVFAISMQPNGVPQILII